MDQTDTEPMDARPAIRRAAVALANEGRPVTVESIGVLAEMSPGDVARIYPSAMAVLADVAGLLIDDHRRAVLAASVIRRRSLTQAVHLGLMAYWAGVEVHLDEHLAVKSLRSSGPGDLMVELDGTVGRLYDTTLAGAESWLRQLARTHEVSWTTPVALLARLLVATVDGVMLDFAVHRDAAAAHRLLQLFSYQLAQHGERNNKAGPTPAADDPADA